MISLKMKPALKMMSRLSMAHSARSASSMIKSDTSGAPGLFVSLNVDDDPKKASIKVTGSQLRVITTEQRALFGIPVSGGTTDWELKSQVREYFGRDPKETWTSDDRQGAEKNFQPYKKWGWEPVTVLLKPVSADIIGVTSEPVILSTKELINNSNIIATFETDISDVVNNSFESTYSSNFAVTMGQEISYGIEGIGGGATSFSFTAEFGTASSTTHATTVGSSSGVSVTLQPHESVIAKLSSFKGTLKARVKYEASLEGLVAVEYEPTYKGHYYWGLEASEVVKIKTIMIEEDLDVTFYSTGTIEVVSKDTHNLTDTHDLTNAYNLTNAYQPARILDPDYCRRL